MALFGNEHNFLPEDRLRSDAWMMHGSAHEGGVEIPSRACDSNFCVAPVMSAMRPSGMSELPLPGSVYPVAKDL